MSHSKVIPEYVKDFEKEWLLIRGINKECGEFIGRLDFSKDLFISPKANRIKYYIKKFLKAQESGRFKDVSGFYFEYFDVISIECLAEELEVYLDLNVDPDSYEFDQERYDFYKNSEYLGLKELFNFSMFIK